MLSVAPFMALCSPESQVAVLHMLGRNRLLTGRKQVLLLSTISQW